MAEIIYFSLCFQRPRVHAGIADVAAGYRIKNLRANNFQPQTGSRELNGSRVKLYILKTCPQKHNLSARMCHLPKQHRQRGIKFQIPEYMVLFFLKTRMYMKLITFIMERTLFLQVSEGLRN